MTERMPTLFIGHGNPMNAIRDTRWSRAWGELGRQLPRPRAVVAISAHWFVPGTAVTAMATPRTIHDFGGFPAELFAVRYPAPGAPELAQRIRELLAPVHVVADTGWGLDHGTWSVLRHLFPAADVPVVQISIDRTRPVADHYALGQGLRALRDEGMLILGSGNVVHNLRAFFANPQRTRAEPWAVDFDATVRRLILAREHRRLVDYQSLGPAAQMAVPTPEHYLPLLYVLGASTDADTIDFPTEGLDGGSLSMLSVRFGQGRADRES